MPTKLISPQRLKVLSQFLDHSGLERRSSGEELGRAERPGILELSGADITRLTGLASGSLYPALINLEEQGLLESRWEESDPKELQRPRRRFYRITGLGESVLRETIEHTARLERLLRPASAASKA